MDCEAGAWLVTTPRLRLSPEPNGAGDATSALFLAGLLAGKAPQDALAHAAGAIFGVLRATAAAGTRELQLIAAQDQLVAPSARFVPRRVR